MFYAIKFKRANIPAMLTNQDKDKLVAVPENKRRCKETSLNN